MSDIFHPRESSCSPYLALVLLYMSPLLPVAFMDMQCYVTVAKELAGTGMLIFGDVAKGLWFSGYTVGTPEYPNRN